MKIMIKIIKMIIVIIVMIVLRDKEKNECKIIDISCPLDQREIKREEEKRENTRRISEEKCQTELFVH